MKAKKRPLSSRPDCGRTVRRLVFRLAPGDQVTMVLYTASFSGNDDFVPTDSDTFTVTESTAFDFIDLPDQSYIMLFELQDAAGNSVWSEPVHFDLQGDAVEVWTDSE